MVPPSGAVDVVLRDLLDHGIGHGDLIVDGGNSDFRDTIRRSAMLRDRGIHFLDVGTSGGPRGAEEGFSFTVGGDTSAYQCLEPYLAAMAAPGGYAHVGPSGSGHFVKMVHNAIEYGMMAAIGEGFELLVHGPYESLDVAKIAYVWNQGGILRSYLLDLTERLLRSNPRLDGIAGYVEDTGLVRAAVREAIDCGVPLYVISDALFGRLRSRQEESFAAKVIAGLRHEFGGHELKRLRDS
jgi:6-phosphogluconate dehydrogenase